MKTIQNNKYRGYFEICFDKKNVVNVLFVIIGLFVCLYVVVFFFSPAMTNINRHTKYIELRLIDQYILLCVRKLM